MLVMQGVVRGEMNMMKMRNYSQEELALDFRKLTNGMLHGLTKDLLLEYLRKRVLQEPVTLRHAGRISQTLRLR